MGVQNVGKDSDTTIWKVLHVGVDITFIIQEQSASRSFLAVHTLFVQFAEQTAPIV